MIHIHTAVEEVTVTRLLAELDRKGCYLLLLFFLEKFF